MGMEIQTWDNVRLSVDAEGVALLVLDVAKRDANVFTAGFMADFCAAVDFIRARTDIRGVIITSGKPGCFSSGADHADLLQVHESGMSALDVQAILMPFARALRALEQGGRPVAAAINGDALGGGFELSLACHYRVLADNSEALIGLPEVRAGLLPGGGGTQRLPRLIGIPQALPLLLSGRCVGPQEALALGLVHALKPQDEVVRAARHWVLANQHAVQPWDVKGYTVPGGAGAMASHAPKSFGLGLARVRMETHDNEPAPLAILSCVYEGTQLPMDRALSCEARHFSALLTGHVARNRLRTLMVNAPRVLRARREGHRTDLDALLASRLRKALDDEWRAQLAEGVPPAMSRNAARQVGLARLPERDGAPAHRPGDGNLSIDDLRAAWLTAAALEAARCLEEGVVDEPAQLDVAAVLDMDFPAWTGGPLSYIDTLGLGHFIEQCERLGGRLGRRFVPSLWLRARAVEADALYVHSRKETV